MTTELEELKRSENSPSLWKLHADSLVALLEVAAALSESAARCSGEAHEQDNKVAGENIKVSLQRLRHRCELIVESLAQTGNRAQPV
jgi:hypothetical protein